MIIPPSKQMKSLNMNSECAASLKQISRTRALTFHCSAKKKEKRKKKKRKEKTTTYTHPLSGVIMT